MLGEFAVSRLAHCRVYTLHRYETTLEHQKGTPCPAQAESRSKELARGPTQRRKNAILLRTEAYFL